MNNWNLAQTATMFTLTELQVIFPALVLLVTSILTLFLAAIYRSNHKLVSKLCFGTTFLGIALSLLTISSMGENAGTLSDFLTLDHGLKGVYALLLLGSLLALGIIYIQDTLSSFISEIYSLILFSLLGMFFLVFSKHLLLMFVALELMSLSVYVIVSLRRTHRSSAEAGLKYFILGALAASFILYGFVLLFGATATFNLSLIAEQLNQAGPDKINLAKLAGVLILSGTLFKIGAFPFHSWVPDVYQGSPASISGWMSTVVKMASFVLLVKVALSVFLISSMEDFFVPLISVVAVITMFAGNLLALQQNRIKRLLAYSSVAHSGYLLVALIAGGTNPKALMSLFIYLASYTILSLTSFGVLSIWENNQAEDLSLDQLSGIGKLDKWSSAFFAFAAMGLAGIPFTVGFIGKFLLIIEGISGRQTFLCVMLVIASLIGAYYYLRIFYVMYLKPTGSNPSLNPNNSIAMWMPTAFLSILNIVFGVLPQFFIPWISSKL